MKSNTVVVTALTLSHSLSLLPSSTPANTYKRRVAFTRSGLRHEVPAKTSPAHVLPCSDLNKENKCNAATQVATRIYADVLGGNLLHPSPTSHKKERKRKTTAVTLGSVQGRTVSAFCFYLFQALSLSLLFSPPFRFHPFHCRAMVQMNRKKQQEAQRFPPLVDPQQIARKRRGSLAQILASMSGESVYALLAAEAAPAAEQKTTKPRVLRGVADAPPPTASTFGIQGTSAVVANMGGEFTEPSIHPAKKAAGTFGREVGSTVDPSNYLKKNTGTHTASRGAPVVDSTKFKKSERSRDRVKPAIPDKHDRPVMGLRTDKDFVVANAVENSMAIPTRNAPVGAIRPTDRADFGEVPEYLKEIKEELRTRQATMQALSAAECIENERWSELNGPELAELRSGLQRRWDVLNKEYQSKGFSSSGTPSQKSHQEALEKALAAVEFAMGKLSRSHVYVYDDER